MGREDGVGRWGGVEAIASRIGGFHPIGQVEHPARGQEPRRNFLGFGVWDRNC